MKRNIAQKYDVSITNLVNYLNKKRITYNYKLEKSAIKKLILVKFLL